MRQSYEPQLPLAPSTIEHPRGAELAMMSAVLDANAALLPITSLRGRMTRSGDHVRARRPLKGRGDRILGGAITGLRARRCRVEAITGGREG